MEVLWGHGIEGGGARLGGRFNFRHMCYSLSFIE